MGMTRGMTRPLEILYKTLSSPVKCGHAYSTTIAHKGTLFTMFSEYNAVGISDYSKPINRLGIHFTRNYSSELSTSEQMNLIKQLRERTSAPIKEVKSALVACNWDIGEPRSFPLTLPDIFSVCMLFYNQNELYLITAETAQKELRKRGVVLASKKSSRTAAEGLLALAQNQNKAVVLELNCETDFVARNDIFQYLVSIKFGSSYMCSIISY